MINKKIIIIFILLILSFLITGCINNTDEVGNIEVIDMINRKVKIKPGTYKKVVCIGAGALRMYSYIGDIFLLSGVEDIDNITLSSRPKMFDSSPRPYILAYSNSLKNLASCGVGGPNAQSPEIEKILNCKPDIVISEYEDVKIASSLEEKLGIPIITLKSGSDNVFDDLFKESLLLLGKVFKKEEKSQTLITFIDNEIKELKRRTVNINETDKPKVYICGLGNWGTTNHLTTAEKYKAFEILNVKNVLNNLLVTKVGPIDEEKFVSIGKDIDIMIIDAAAVKNIIPLYKKNPKIFDNCKAWLNNEVYLEMAFNAYYTNYELALINAWYIGSVIYPTLFSDIDITVKTNQITKAFLQKELAEEIFNCEASFGGYQKIDTNKFFK